MEEFKVTFDPNTARCLEECPHKVTGKSGGIIMLGSMSCKDRCQYHGNYEENIDTSYLSSIKCLFLDTPISKELRQMIDEYADLYFRDYDLRINKDDLQRRTLDILACKHRVSIR